VTTANISTDCVEHAGPVVLALDDFECFSAAWMAAGWRVIDCLKDFNLKLVVVRYNKPITII
jgi:hypothetical protein